MKKIFYILSLLALICSVVFAQHPISRKQGGTGPWRLADTGKVLTLTDTINGPSWQPASGGGGGDTDYTANNNWFGEKSGNTTLTGAFNVAAGIGALNSITRAANNVALGYRSLYSDTAGSNNIAIGYQALSALKNAADDRNIAIGTNTLLHNDGGRNNIAIGYEALKTNITGIDNLVIGNTAMKEFDAGIQNIAIGCEAGQRIDRLATSYLNDVFIGYAAGNTAPVDISNTFISGSNEALIYNVYFGCGYRSPNQDGTDYAIRGSGAGLGLMDANGGSITLAGGISTGSGTGGDIIFKSSPAGGSGTDDNSLSELFRMKSTGEFQIAGSSGTAGQVVTSGGAGIAASWTTPSGGSPYGWKDDGGSPVNAPFATGSKAVATGDSAFATGFNSIAIGTGAHATGYKSISIGSVDSWNGGQHQASSGAYSIAIGQGDTVRSDASIGIGLGVFDKCSFNTPGNEIGGGGNIMIGYSAYNDTGSFNTAVGWSAQNYGRSGVALGDGAVAWKGSNNMSLGSNAGSGSQTGKYSRQIFISSTDGVTDGNVSHFDSTALYNGLNLLAYARGAYYQGYNNANTASGTDSDLWVLGAGKVYANTNARWNAASISRHGNFVAGGTITATNFSGTSSGTNTGDKNPNTYQNSPSDPTATSSGSPTMMGIAGSITPSLNGKVLIIISGNFQNSLATIADTVQLRYGTGAAPSNGAAASGTQIGTFLALRGTANIPIPFSMQGIVTGLTVSTAYWVDIAVDVAGGTSAVKNLNVSIVEF